MQMQIKRPNANTEWKDNNQTTKLSARQLPCPCHRLQRRNDPRVSEAIQVSDNIFIRFFFRFSEKKIRSGHIVYQLLRIE